MFTSYFAFPGVGQSPSSFDLTPNRKSAIIKQVVCEEYNVTPDDLHGKCRKRLVADARHVTMYFIKNMTTTTLTEIAQIFGKDHSTVIHANNKVRNLIEVDIRFSDALNGIFAKINYKMREYRKQLQEMRDKKYLAELN